MPVRARRVSLQRTVGSKPLLTRTHRERGLLGEIIVPGLMHRRLVLDPGLHVLKVVLLCEPLGLRVLLEDILVLRKVEVSADSAQFDALGVHRGR